MWNFFKETFLLKQKRKRGKGKQRKIEEKSENINKELYFKVNFALHIHALDPGFFAGCAIFPVGKSCMREHCCVMRAT